MWYNIEEREKGVITIVYLDNAATTFIDNEAINIITQSLQKDYINPSALYSSGREKFNEIQHCKKRISNNLGLEDSNSIYFTSGGCEGNNWIIKGCVAEYYRYHQNERSVCNSTHSCTIKKPHIITTTFEHHSVLNACKQLEDLGLAKITYVKPNKYGFINVDDIKRNISPINSNYCTILVSVMWINNVLGTIQPIQEIGDVCKIANVKFHTDAVQAASNVHINLSQYNIDFMTMSGHKFHAPKGIGIVYIKDKTYLQPMISGGGQEYGMRAGTENLPYIKAITYCLEKYNNKSVVESKRLYIESIKQILINNLHDINNSMYFKSSNGVGTFNIAFKDLISDMLVYNLGERGYMVSIGSACDNGNFEDSHVLTSVNYSKDYINGNIRVTFNTYNTLDEIKNFCTVLKEEIYKLRGY